MREKFGVVSITLNRIEACVSRGSDRIGVEVYAQGTQACSLETTGDSQSELAEAQHKNVMWTRFSARRVLSDLTERIAPFKHREERRTHLIELV